MADNGAGSTVGTAVNSISTLVPASQVQLSRGAAQPFDAGQAYLLWDQVSGHTVTHGIAVADLGALAVVNDYALTESATDSVVSPDGKFIYVTGSDDLLVIQTDTFDVTPVALTLPPGTASPNQAVPLVLLTGVAITADGTQLLVAGQQKAQTQQGYIAVVDPIARTVQRALTANATDFQAHHIAVSSDGRYAIVNLQMQRIDVIDLQRFTIAHSVMFNPNAVLAIAAHPSLASVFVAVGPLGGATGSILTIDLETASIAGTFALPAAPRQLAVSPDGNRLYVTVSAPNSPPQLVVLCAQHGTQMGSLPSAGPFAIDPAGQNAYVFDSAAKVLNIIDLTS